MANFLYERKQIVTVRGHSSKPVTVLSGVPQGSVLGPLLFILYVNELPELVSSKIRMFAEDTKVYNKSASYRSLQIDLENLEKWSKQWLLKFNTDKCKVHFGNGNPRHNYVLGTSNLLNESDRRERSWHLCD